MKNLFQGEHCYSQYENITFYHGLELKTHTHTLTHTLKFITIYYYVLPEE